MTMNTPQPSPALYRIMRTSIEPAADSLRLDSYLLHVRSTKCSCCAAAATWTEVHEVWIDRYARTRRLAPTNEVKPGMVVGITRLPVRSIPLCHECCDEVVAVGAL